MRKGEDVSERTVGRKLLSELVDRPANMAPEPSSVDREVVALANPLLFCTWAKYIARLFICHQRMNARRATKGNLRFVRAITSRFTAVASGAL